MAGGLASNAFSTSVGDPATTATPDSDTAGVVTAFDCSTSEASAVPIEVGTNAIVTLQLAAGASGAAQVLRCVKSPAPLPVSVISPIVSAPAPVLVTEIVWGVEAVPTAIVGKFALGALRLTVGAIPLPDSATALLDAIPLRTITLADNAPAADGANAIETVQEPAGGNEAAQPFASLKDAASAPDTATPSIMSVELPGLMISMACVGLCTPSGVSAKDSAAGDSWAADVAGAPPEPPPPQATSMPNTAGVSTRATWRQRAAQGSGARPGAEIVAARGARIRVSGRMKDASCPGERICAPSPAPTPPRVRPGGEKA